MKPNQGVLLVNGCHVASAWVSSLTDLLKPHHDLENPHKGEHLFRNLLTIVHRDSWLALEVVRQNCLRVLLNLAVLSQGGAQFENLLLALLCHLFPLEEESEWLGEIWEEIGDLILALLLRLLFVVTDIERASPWAALCLLLHFIHTFPELAVRTAHPRLPGGRLQ